MKAKLVYVCSSCGGKSMRWQGQCPSCGEWNTLAATDATPKGVAARLVSTPGLGAARPIPLHAATATENHFLTTGLAGLDTVLGRGLPAGAAVLLAGEPGVGKSTLLLQLAANLARSGSGTLYASGEESLPQLHQRAVRLGTLVDSLRAVSTNSADDVLHALDAMEEQGALIVDSVQTMALSGVDGLPGTPSQVRAVACALIEKAKQRGVALILVGHVTKDGQIAGPKMLEHMVDTVLSLEGDRREQHRLLRVLKNRFGPTDELLVLAMREKGLDIIDDPSTLFLGDRDPEQTGAAVAMVLDGGRAFAVEVQALVTRSFAPQPRRVAVGIDTGRLLMLLAVLEKRLGLSLGQTDVHAKIGGGLRTQDPGLDAALAAAVLSSFYDRSLPAKAALWGEVDLGGRIRPVTGHDVREKQAKRLGYGPLFHGHESPKGPARPLDIKALSRKLFGAGE